jgi:hypothetical protein
VISEARPWRTFTALTGFLVASSSTRTRPRALALAASQRDTGAYEVVGALALYLDFVNLFLFMLRFLGRRRNLR